MNSEQATALSDGVLALEALGLAGLLWWRRPAAAETAGPLAALLAATGIAAALGGAWHAGQPDLAPAAGFWLWKLTLVAIGLGDACLLAAFARAPALRPRARLARGVILGKLAVYGACIVATDSFLPALGDQVLTLAAGLAVIAWDATHEGRLPGSWLAAAIGLALAGGVIQAAGLDVGGLLNHNVLYHLCVMLALAGFWAAARIWDHAGAPKPSTSASTVVSEDSAP